MLNIGACGLDCGNCEAFKATQANDLKKLTELAASWSSADQKWKPEDMKCEGCTGSRTFKGCQSCPVRTCAQEKGAKICSRCADYPCDKLEKRWAALHGDVKAWKANLEKAMQPSA